MNFSEFGVANFDCRESDPWAQTFEISLPSSQNLPKFGFWQLASSSFPANQSFRSTNAVSETVSAADFLLNSEASNLVASSAISDTTPITPSSGGLTTPIAPETRERRSANDGFYRVELTTENADLVLGGIGRDWIQGGGGDDELHGLDGDDRLLGNRGRDQLWGNDGHDWIQGGQGADSLWGGSGNDQLLGDLGDDWLAGELGIDTLTGGLGADRFLIGMAMDGGTIDQADLILDFRTSEADQLVLPSGQGFADLDFIAGTGNNSGDTIVRDRATGRNLAILKGVSPNSFNASNVVSQDSLAPTPAVIRFSKGNFLGVELDGKATVTLERSVNTATDVSVSFSTSGGTATPNQDFTPITGSIVFGAGETRKTISIPLTDDRRTEPNETVMLLLSNPVGAELDLATATLTISDNGL
ncbi:MAG: Calx-beta domain-containing protein [Limnothrix sp. BL-A-16]